MNDGHWLALIVAGAAGAALLPGGAAVPALAIGAALVLVVAPLLNRRRARRREDWNAATVGCVVVRGPEGRRALVPTGQPMVPVERKALGR
jgi:H+/Cl- antiporter ClcA